MSYTELLNPLEFFWVIGGPLVLMRQFWRESPERPDPDYKLGTFSLPQPPTSGTESQAGDKADINDAHVMEFP